MPHTRRSEGQTIAFVGVGLVREVAGAVVVIGSSVGTVVISGEGVSIITVEVTSGIRVAYGVAAGEAEGKILNVPEIWRNTRMAVIAMITITAMIMTFLSGCFSAGSPGGMVPAAGTGDSTGATAGVVPAPDAGSPEAGIRVLPHDVQNFTPSSFSCKQRGHGCVKSIPP